MSSTGCADTTEPFALRVVGDSMTPEFNDGNIIIVDPSLRALHQAFVVLDYGGEILFGQFWIQEGRHWLQYLNPEHQAVELIGKYECKGVIVQRSTGRRKELKHYDYPVHSH